MRHYANGYFSFGLLARHGGRYEKARYQCRIAVYPTLVDFLGV